MTDLLANSDASIKVVRNIELRKFHDSRGSLFEMIRNEWVPETAPIQWNAVASKKNVIRGFHVHPNHTDYLVCILGTFTIKMRDLREKSPTYLLYQEVEMDAENPRALVIPPGVGHGFEFEYPSYYCYGIDSYWSLKDEFDCRYDDEELGIQWSLKTPLLSDRDNHSGTFSKLQEQLGPFQKFMCNNLV